MPDALIMRLTKPSAGSLPGVLLNIQGRQEIGREQAGNRQGRHGIRLKRHGIGREGRE